MNGVSEVTELLRSIRATLRDDSRLSATGRDPHQRPGGVDGGNRKQEQRIVVVHTPCSFILSDLSSIQRAASFLHGGIIAARSPRVLANPGVLVHIPSPPVVELSRTCRQHKNRSWCELTAFMG